MNRLYTIKEVSMRSGLSTQLIRKWEERYEAVKPARFPNGYRGYTKKDVETLIWLKSKADQGMPIGLAVQEQLLLNSSASAEIMLAEQAEPESVLERSELKEYQQRLVSLFLQLDHTGAQRFFDQLVALHQMDFILLKVLQPTLIEIGTMWEQGEISEYQEHFGSHFIRERLLALKNLFSIPTGSPKLITACSPFERHELGILFLGYFALQNGFETIYLGATPSEKGIFDCLRQQQPAAFAFGTTMKSMLQESVPFYMKLDRSIVEQGLDTRVFIGGSVIEEDAILPGTKRIYLLSGDAREAMSKVKKLTAN
ncbi:MerR family transcriptional regulator [Paenibacillus lutrae]|uniref:MerR family transcriptional regulator n=1 Tax=Paenibacillus lutrae TaxID=2078573 RepID=A0A7X3JYQ4_9BACL|nr:B12-binding domain-containing protein [Paenibacillus lutrae]MVO99242.1 MerR family transcriptional regulator [Paenibacillus lutrae]